VPHETVGSMRPCRACPACTDRPFLPDVPLTSRADASRLCERTSAGIVDEPLSEAETRALKALLEASRCASRALQSARPHGTMLSRKQPSRCALDHAAPDDADGISSFPPSPPHSARVQAATATTQSTMQTKEMSLRAGQRGQPQSSRWACSQAGLRGVHCFVCRLSSKVSARRFSCLSLAPLPSIWRASLCCVQRAACVPPSPRGHGWHTFRRLLGTPPALDAAWSLVGSAASTKFNAARDGHTWCLPLSSEKPPSTVLAGRLREVA